MEDVATPPKKSTTLSVDRAAFLLLRVKKAFKKKRQHRKEKQTQLTASHNRSCRRVTPPPPLLRSRTLPAIIVPGFPVVSLHTDSNTFHLEEYPSAKTGSNRWSMLTRSNASSTSPNYNANNNNINNNNSNNNNNTLALKSLNLLKDDSSIVYRRKSSGSAPHSVAVNNNNACDEQQQPQQQQQQQQQQQPTHMYTADAALMQTGDDFECQADGSVMLRIPAPHVVAARAYRLATKKRGSSACEIRLSDCQKPNTNDGSLQQAATATGATTSHANAASSSSSGASSSSNTALTRLAKLLHQSGPSSMSKSSAITSTSATTTPHGDYNMATDDAPRRLSWERRKNSNALQRSSSIDSFAEIVWSDSPRPSLDIPRPAVPFSKRPSASSLFSNCSSTSSQNAQLNINYVGDIGNSSSNSAGNSRRESLLSPSSTRRNKLTRIINDNILPSNRNHKCIHDNDLSDSENGVVVLRKSSSSGSSKSSSSNSSSSSSSGSSSNRGSSDYYHNQHVAHENHVERDRSQHINNNTFRWSEQLTQNVSVAKIRTAISCTEHDLKEMEYLLPHVSSAVTSSKTSSSSSSSSSSTTPSTAPIANTEIIDDVTLRSATLPLSSSNQHTTGLSVSRRHARALSHHYGTNNTTTTTTINANNMSNPKNAKLNAEQKDASCSDDQNVERNGQNLIIHRQPTSMRINKGGGNTPLRSKMSKKQLKLAQAQLDKLSQINLHLHALFSAVEHGHLDKARTILESTDVDVNSINADGLSALDVAVLSNNRSMTKMLLQHGAVESSQFSSDNIGSKLKALLKDAESRIHDLSRTESGSGQPTFTSRPSISNIIIGNTGSSVTGCTGSEIDKQIGIWERRIKGLGRMMLGWDQARPPDMPASVTVDVTGDNSITVQILEPFEGAIATKFKVQWSTRADFSNVVGEREIMDWTSFHGTMGAQCYISGLTQGRRYFLRATCGNLKGWGPYQTSIPGSIIPSSWRDLNGREDRYLGRQRILDNLFTAVRLARPADVSELTLETSTAQRRNPKKKTTIKQLFSVASKFQKTLRRGIYFASIIYCEDKVLVTSEDFLPVIEIDETYPSTLHSDYHWLMKVACTWDDVKSLRTDMERNLTSAVHFRTKLLSAVCQMQSALGLTDLGQLYYKPLRDSHGTVVLSCIQSVKNQKTVSILNSRWLPVNKLQKKIVALHEDYNINEMLISSIAEQMQYHHSSMEQLAPGLYLGYLKMQCSMDQIQVVVPAKTPNVLPHYKVRDNSHITAEEWHVLKRGDAADTTNDRGSPLRLPLELNANSEATTEVQRLFLYDLTTAAYKLFAYMNIKPEDAFTHRLYDIEVIEHSKDISFLIVCPSVELTCAVPGQSELLLQREDLASLSIQSFEMIHLRTYQPGIIQKYARLSCILELDTALANHSHREAFSTSELQTAKERLAKLQELTLNLNVVWKSVRWLMDVIAFARDKNAQPSHAMRKILEFGQSGDEMSHSINNKHQLLQLPTRDGKYSKSGPGRGSWPGPAGMGQTGSDVCLVAEHSKSEQNLGVSVITQVTARTGTLESTHQTTMVGAQKENQNLLQVTSEFSGSNKHLRKNSGDSMSSQYTTRSLYSTADSAAGSNNELTAVFAIPPSRSDDTLAQAASEAQKHMQSAMSHQRKRTISNVVHASTPTSLTAPHPISSTPFLSRNAPGSSLSLKNVYCSMQTGGGDTPTGAPCMSKVKAASSTNLREGGLYLKTTLSALQTEIKANTKTDESAASKPSTSSSASSATKSLSRHSSDEESPTGYLSVASDHTAAATAVTGPTSSTSSGIIQVYTAYDTGLASGTSLKLHVTPKTSAREVINLVVKQLNMAAMLKGHNAPIYTGEMLDNFCLVAVIGARERCLRDDFKPLQLQNPWKKGRLYVRQKHELLAAIEHSNRKSHLI